MTAPRSPGGAASCRGVAVVLALLAMTLVSALVTGLIVVTTVERVSSANLDDAVALANASEAALELAVGALEAIADWDEVLNGTRTSGLVDGPPGARILGPSETVDLVGLGHVLTCGRPTPCSAAQIRAITLDRPWGANNPRWQIFLHQPLTAPPLPGPAPRLYAAVWIGDDGGEVDGDPGRDGAGPNGEGRYVVRARAESFSARGGRHAIDAELARVCDAGPAGPCGPGVRIRAWRVVAGGR